MKGLFSLCLLAFLAPSQLDAKDQRVINGITVNPPYMYPFMAALYRKGKFTCGGTFITQDIVITAAHCFSGNRVPISEVVVQIHRHDLRKNITEEGGQEFKILKKWIPDDYDVENFYNDIALLKVNGKGPKPTIRLNSNAVFSEGHSLTALGWGAVKVGGAAYPLLQKVALPIANRKKCIDVFRSEIDYELKDNQICAGHDEGGKDTCQGDSGGPLFALNRDQFVLVGLVSNGISCAKPGTPAIYTSISSYYPTIVKVLSEWKYR